MATSSAESLMRQLSAANEEAWLALGRIADMMGDDQNTMLAYEKVLSHNRMNATALSAIGCVYEKLEDYTKAADCFRGLVSLNEQNSDAWGHLGYCCLMMNDLTSAHTAYQYAMYNNPTSQKDPNMWYGIGQLYERLGSLEHAQESFEAVLRFEPNFNMALEVKFRLGIIAKQRGDYDGALESLKSVLHDVQTNVQTTDMASDIWTQIGHVYELKEEIQLAKSSYLKVAELNPNNAKPLQQLGWLCLKHSEHAPAIDYLKKAVTLDPQDGKGWYLLGRCYMAVHEFEEAYDSYKHAVTTDPQNPNVWCSLGVLFYQLNQHLDALDAYSRAININPNICEVWYNIGTLYDTCNQTSDARDAYQKAAELGADAQFIRERLDLLRARETGQPTMGMAGANSAPGPSEPPTTSPMPTFTSRPTAESTYPAQQGAPSQGGNGTPNNGDASSRLAAPGVMPMQQHGGPPGGEAHASQGMSPHMAMIGAGGVASRGEAMMHPAHQQHMSHHRSQTHQLQFQPHQQQQQHVQQRHPPPQIALQHPQITPRHPQHAQMQHRLRHPMQQQGGAMSGRSMATDGGGLRYAMDGEQRKRTGPPATQRQDSFGSKQQLAGPPMQSRMERPTADQQQHQQQQRVHQAASMGVPPVRR